MPATAVLDQDRSDVARSPQLAQPTASRRYRYVRRDHRSLTHVIVDIDAKGHEDWAEQASDEIRWYAFVPSRAERNLLRSWQQTGQPPRPRRFVPLVP